MAYPIQLYQIMALPMPLRNSQNLQQLGNSTMSRPPHIFHNLRECGKKRARHCWRKLNWPSQILTLHCCIIATLQQNQPIFLQPNAFLVGAHGHSCPPLPCCLHQRSLYKFLQKLELANGNRLSTITRQLDHFLPWTVEIRVWDYLAAAHGV